MTRQNRSYWVYVASDGKEFDDTEKGREECMKHEKELRSPCNLRLRLEELISYMNGLKRSGNSTCLRNLQEKMILAKKGLLQTAKGKRRHTYVFSKQMEIAAHAYNVAKEDYEKYLRAFYRARDEYKAVKKEYTEKVHHI